MSALMQVPACAAATTRSWRARLQLQLLTQGDRTVLGRSRHEGPLRVQRAFYPEGGLCHLYVLHPPGGIATGDQLLLELNVADAAQALITTPSAGKVYGVDSRRHPQQQTLQARLGVDAHLEWLPQETIVFDNAELCLQNRFDLAPCAELISWDVLCLGRRASGEQFRRGRCLQQTALYREGRPLHIERNRFEGGAELLGAHWGLRGASVSGSLLATLRANRAQLDAWRALLAALPGHWGITQKPEVLVVRYLGDSAETCRRGFEQLWRELRSAMWQRPVCRPGIWNT